MWLVSRIVGMHVCLSHSRWLFATRRVQMHIVDFVCMCFLLYHYFLKINMEGTRKRIFIVIIIIIMVVIESLHDVQNSNQSLNHSLYLKSECNKE